MRKGQTATEYLVILCVVIIIALIVAYVMGGFPHQSGYDRTALATEMCGELDMVYLSREYNMVTCQKFYGSGIANETMIYHVDWDSLDGLYGGEDG